MTSLTRVALLAVLASFAGCATLADTPAQERTYARLQACGVNANAAYIKADKGWWMQSTGSSSKTAGLLRVWAVGWGVDEGNRLLGRDRPLGASPLNPPVLGKLRPLPHRSR
jgi:hypothetical protein